jgi:hypothetical protein
LEVFKKLMNEIESFDKPMQKQLKIVKDAQKEAAQD